MSLIEYKTVPAYSHANTEEYPEWFRGQAVHSTYVVGTLGSVGGTTQSDVSSWLQSGQKQINNSDALFFKGDNGKDHWMTVVIDADEALWVPADRLESFSIVTQQNSTAGHSLYTSKIGLKFRNQAGSEHLYLTNRLARLGHIDRWVTKVPFTAQQLETLQGYYVSGFVIEVSTEHGQGTRASELKVGNLKFYYNHGPEDTRWVVGAMRPPEKIAGEGSIKFN